MKPLCRTCGKALKRKLEYIVFQERVGAFIGRTTRPENPTTRKEVERLVNIPVVYLRRCKQAGKEHLIAYAALWDGESYVDPYFCSNRCAETLGRCCAREGTWLQRAIDIRDENRKDVL